MFDYSDQIKKLSDQGLKRQLRVRDGALVNFSSNDYLGLSQHETVIAAATDAVKKFGAGATASRLISGTLPLHEQLEKKLASFLGKEAALVFGSGYQTNVGILPVLAGAGDVIFFDHLCHASLIDGIRLSAARYFSFDHNDMAHLEKLLQQKRSAYNRAFVVTEGIFSMDGDTSPIKSIVDVAHKNNALVYLDESHSFGVVGPEGRGWAADQDVLARVDLLMGTLSKSVGSQGGFLATSRDVVDLLISRSRSFIYTTALAPACVGAALAAVNLFPEMQDRRAKVAQASADFRDQLRKAKYSVLTSTSQIVPVWTGDLPSTKALSDHLFSQGFFVPSIRPPTVPQGEGRVRLSLTYDVVQNGLGFLLETFQNYQVRPARQGEHVAQVG